jgi:hypothetical protein
VTSPHLYRPADLKSHDYQVRALNAFCESGWSPVKSGADKNETPGRPAITSIVDPDPNAPTGITVSYTEGSLATSHDLYKDGTLAATGFVSGSTYIPGDAFPHAYTVRARRTSCFNDSHAVQGTDTAGPPPEIAEGATPDDAQAWSSDKATHLWPSELTATGYRLHRGDASTLQDLLGGGDDSCTSYEGKHTSINLAGDDPSGVPGRLYWYLVVAYNLAGDGPAGNTAEGPRQLDSTGACP